MAGLVMGIMDDGGRHCFRKCWAFRLKAGLGYQPRSVDSVRWWGTVWLILRMFRDKYPIIERNPGKRPLKPLTYGANRTNACAACRLTAAVPWPTQPSSNSR